MAWLALISGSSIGTSGTSPARMPACIRGLMAGGKAVEGSCMQRHKDVGRLLNASFTPVFGGQTHLMFLRWRDMREAQGRTAACSWLPLPSAMQVSNRMPVRARVSRSNRSDGPANQRRPLRPQGFRARSFDCHDQPISRRAVKRTRLNRSSRQSCLTAN